jgi:organic hydroperoxide reductase OsmC/OhrA
VTRPRPDSHRARDHPQESDKAAFAMAVEGAKSGCPISKLLDAKITFDAKLA